MFWITITLNLVEEQQQTMACFGPSRFQLRNLCANFSPLKELTPDFSLVEVLFTMIVTATGLSVFSLLIRNVINFYQALRCRSLEKSVRGLDIYFLYGLFLHHANLKRILCCVLFQSGCLQRKTFYIVPWAFCFEWGRKNHDSRT